MIVLTVIQIGNTNHDTPINNASLSTLHMTLLVVSAKMFTDLANPL